MKSPVAMSLSELFVYVEVSRRLQELTIDLETMSPDMIHVLLFSAISDAIRNLPAAIAYAPIAWNFFPMTIESHSFPAIYHGLLFNRDFDAT